MLMRCALYCRVSTTDQNCSLQLRELREYISRREVPSMPGFGVTAEDYSRLTA